MHQFLPGQFVAESSSAAPASVGTARSRDLASRRDQSIRVQAQTGLNLFLALKSPAQMPSLLNGIKKHQDATDAALMNLSYVHFARFLPSQDFATLMVITTFDGDLEPYLMDFVVALGDVFNFILHYVKGAPRLPVERYPRDFCDFVRKNNFSMAGVWSAYPKKTVIDIIQ